MGVILKLLYRGDALGKQACKRMFLDMEENIHIHFRDLRIEMSRAEFEEFTRAFNSQSGELMEIVRSRGYKDGELPNANQDEVRIWTNSRLNAPVKYHPRRISLEKCTDGVHFHYRNYKLLLNDQEFEALTEIFREICLDKPYASNNDEILALLTANEVGFSVLGRTSISEPNGAIERLRIRVKDYHILKVNGILKGIGLKAVAGQSPVVFCGKNCQVEITREVTQPAPDSRPEAQTRLMLLTDYLKQNVPINPDHLNSLKTQILDTLKRVSKSDTPLYVNLDFRQWIYDRDRREVIFPSSSKPEGNARTEYRRWSAFLKKLNFFFVKPTKVFFDAKTQKETHDRIVRQVIESVSKVPEIDRVYLMGSVKNKKMGVYRAPFIHSEWAKLASDVDLLIELHEGDEFSPPPEWEYINRSTANDCDIYHIGQVTADDRFGFKKKYPNIDFFDHLLDAYVYIPGACDIEKKDRFFERFAPERIFECERGLYSRLETVLAESFSHPVSNLSKLEVSTENDLYCLDLGNQPCILKVYKVSGNYASSRLLEHTLYESEVVQSLTASAEITAQIVETKNTETVFKVDGSPAVVFQRLPGEMLKGNDIPLCRCAEKLAEFHHCQPALSPQHSQSSFTFVEMFRMWRDAFERFSAEYAGDEEIRTCFSQLSPLLGELNQKLEHLINDSELHVVQNHGDVQPRNFISHNDQLWLIDLQNAFFGPRLLDVVEGAIEFAWHEDPSGQPDIRKFDQFVQCYSDQNPLSDAEQSSFNDLVEVVALMKFTKEVRMIKSSRNPANLRRQRALSIAGFILAR